MNFLLILDYIIFYGFELHVGYYFELICSLLKQQIFTFNCQTLSMIINCSLICEYFSETNTWVRQTLYTCIVQVKWLGNRSTKTLTVPRLNVQVNVCNIQWWVVPQVITSVLIVTHNLTTFVKPFPIYGIICMTSFLF